MKIYNSLSNKYEEFVVEGNHIRWYMCGPTVYDSAHIGHARNYISNDVMRRILEYLGYDVTLVMNITNIDDKIIQRAEERKMNWKELADHYEEEFLTDMKALGVKPATVITRVSDFVPQIVNYIDVLVEKGYAYLSNGSVYFDVRKYRELFSYPQFVKKQEEYEDNHQLEKKNKEDFALWKKVKEDEPFWESKFGNGRMGWHIECSNMASILGDELDLHSGGEDLKFPHHDNEIAQSQAYYGKKWVKYFLHIGHLHIEGRKMAKSEKNFITIQDALKNYTSRQLRLLFLLHKYNFILDYCNDSMKYVADIEASIIHFFNNIKERLGVTPNVVNSKYWLDQYVELKKKTREYLAHDFDTHSILHLFRSTMSMINKVIANKDNIDHALILQIVSYMREILEMLGFELMEYRGKEEELRDIIVNYRKIVRLGLKQKDYGSIFKASDQLRDEILPSLGIHISDN